MKRVPPIARIPIIRVMIVVWLGLGLGSIVTEARMDSWYWNTFLSLEDRKQAIALAKVLYGHYGESDQNFMPRITDLYFTSLVCFMGFLVLRGTKRKRCSIFTAVDVLQLVLLFVGMGLHYFLKEPAQNYFANLPHWQSHDLDIFHLEELARYHTLTFSLLILGLVVNLILVVMHIVKIVTKASNTKSFKRNKSR